MSNEMVMDIIKDPQAFINEIVRNHGASSIQHSWAVTAVREVQAQVNKANN